MSYLLIGLALLALAVGAAVWLVRAALKDSWESPAS